MAIHTDFISFSYIGMIIVACVITFVYGTNNWKGGLSQKLTTLYLIFYSYGLLVSSIIANGYIIYLPHLSRTGILMLFFMNPVIYLALEKGIFKTQLIKLEIWHLAPALLYIINFFPYFIKSSEEKISIILTNEYSLFEEGWLLPPYTVLVIALFQIIYYLYMIYKKFIENKKSYNSSIYYSQAKLFWGLTAFHSIVIFTTAFGMYSGEIRGSFHIIYNIGNLIFFYLFLNKPEIMFPKKIK